MATERDLLAARIFFRAVFPVIRVLLEDDPSMKKKFEGVTATVQFAAKNGSEIMGAFLVFDKGDFSVGQGIADEADITFSFSTVEKMNSMLSGGAVLPKISGFTKLGLLVKVLSLLMGLKIMMPDSNPKKPEKRRLKVRMSFYMITTALSQYNKGGDPEMVKWTEKQPDRIYQITVGGEENISAYLRVKAGKTKAGRGVYTRRRPFVHMKFSSVDGAMAVLMKECEFVSAAEKGYVSIDGSPEYGANLNDFMQRIQALVS